MPDAEVRVSEDVVRGLLEEHHPDLASESLHFVDEGWDNVTYRLGAELAVRVPRRQAAVVLLSHERRWLPEIAGHLSVMVPLEVRAGRPSGSYPWIWSVVRWIAGRTVDEEPPTDDQALPLAGDLKRLHSPAPDDAPANPLRGEPLRTRNEFVQTRIASLKGELSALRPGLLRAWLDGVSADDCSRRVWIHGDLHPRNVLVHGGQVVGIIDWGDMTSGDPATDLAAAWTLPQTDCAAQALLEEYGADGPTRARALAWGVFFGAALATSGEPRHERIGKGILGRLPIGPGRDA
jgi:aminoglycoside phosphotransferase (APT) family kinase protein